jgi:hypothetical protein
MLRTNLEKVRGLLKSLFIESEKALQFDVKTFILTYYLVLFSYSFVHALIVHSVIGWEGLVRALVRVILSCSLSLAVSLPAVFGYYVLTPKAGFDSSMKKFLFYFVSVLLITLLGETFTAKFIALTDLKAQPLVTLIAGLLSLALLARAVKNRREILIMLLIAFISQVQAYWIVDDLLPYPYVERIDSPLIAWMRNLIKKGRPW